MHRARSFFTRWKRDYLQPAGRSGELFAQNLRQIQARTASGEIDMYAPEERLVFTGGITPARGHEGDNALMHGAMSFFTRWKRDYLQPAGRSSELFAQNRRQIQARTVSGEIAMYAPEGGITRARGHEGGDAGRDALVSLLAKHQPATSNTPVYGCPIRSEL